MTVVDARGHLCPVPSLRLRRALESASPGVRVTLLATDPMARIDVPFLMQELGGRMISVEEVGGELSLVVETAGAPPD
ncbi:sulfurtransferase TusA family protein [Brevundimonas sp. VNH65]|uniref:sulfurtransferase TusA family protein n=1 Tax=Brevundimonas sp. VNH65 TaxID=3400917 RepID=UPI003BFE322A